MRESGKMKRRFEATAVVLVWRLEGEKEEERVGADGDEGMGEGCRRREWKGRKKKK